MNLLEVKNLKKHFPVNNSLLDRFKKEKKYVHAINDISFNIKKGEVLSLVGESGCGKSTTGRTILGAYQATAGSIYYQEQEISNLDEKERFPLRRKMQMIFQDPYASLNPRMKVKDIIAESVKTHKLKLDQSIDNYVLELMNKVGLNPEYVDRYPHQFSGGQRQRIGIARALAVKPDFIVADEPISALDVSIQAQILNLLLDLKDEFDLTYLFIAHDLSVVKHISDRVAIMYLGKIFEIGSADDIFRNPLHPYTQALFSSIPILTEKTRDNYDPLAGDVPNPIELPQGCYFHTRCKYARDICRKKVPELSNVDGREVACHFVETGREKNAG